MPRRRGGGTGTAADGLAAGVLAAVALACGCGPLRPYGPGSLSEGSVVLDVPAVRQDDRRTCGFAVLAMLSQYYGTEIREEDRERVRAEASSEDGVSGRFIKDVLERNGFRVYIFAGKLLDGKGPRGILYHLDRGRPLVVMLSADRSRHHYMVVSGLDTERDLVVGVDPGKGRVICRGGAFRRMWERSNSFTLVAVPVKTNPRDGGEARPTPD
jgi:ABC-type bacteriocin/lantibiotic exporter with double-glycine peptidase domain